MALLPYLLDIGLRPKRRYLDDIFDLEELINRPLKIRKWSNLSNLSLPDAATTIKSDKDKFQVNVDVQHFAPEEITVKTVDGFIVVEGKHEEKQDDHGYVSRQFSRRYALPKDCDSASVVSKLSTDGVLSILAPKKVKGEGNVRMVPITHTGPVRREQADEDEDEGVKMEVEKSPQKKPAKRQIRTA